MLDLMFDDKSRIIDLTNGERAVLIYNTMGNNYSGPLVFDIIKAISMTGIYIPDVKIGTVDINFKDAVLAYQRKYGLPDTGVVDDTLLRGLYIRASEVVNSEIEEDDVYDSDISTEDLTESDVYDAHYDPFFLNKSSKVYRKNHKDIVISLGNGANVKVIKDVFMRSVSVQVDTSGNPISETYNFIARDIKESDAAEDINKYIGEEANLNTSSDIKYSYETLFKDY